jgi:hypothetical protein
VPASLLRFGGFDLDPANFQLRRAGRPLRLERIPMEVLLLLVERRGQLVLCQEIVESVWGRDVVLDIDNALNTAIRKVRHVPGGRPGPRSIRRDGTGQGLSIHRGRHLGVPAPRDAAPDEPAGPAVAACRAGTRARRRRKPHWLASPADADRTRWERQDARGASARDPGRRAVSRRRLLGPLAGDP